MKQDSEEVERKIERQKRKYMGESVCGRIIKRKKETRKWMRMNSKKKEKKKSKEERN